MDIVIIEGLVKYKITLDPGVWIFDDRKVELSTFLHKEEVKQEKDSDERFISKQWDREIRSGAAPPTHKSEKKFKKEQILTGTFGIPLLPFINNAEPTEDASKLVIHTSDKDTHVVSLTDAKEAILGFSIDGKPLTEDGPIHFYFGDGSNKDNPIKNIIKLTVK